jgi:hypothetical protein
MKILSLLLAFIVAASVFSCKKEKTFTDLVPEELKPYSMFQVGSYWIYRNEQTTKLDCTYIKSPPEFYFYYYESGSKTQSMGLQYNGSFISQTYCGPYGGGTSSYSLTYRIVGRNGISLISSHITPGYVSKESYWEYKVLSITDSLNLNNVKYNEVITTQYKMVSSPSMDSIVLTFYLAKKIGLIKFDKKVNSTDTIWSLMRSHTLQ